MGRRAAIVWFRQDLRLHDNEALTEALEHAQEVLPVYIFDPRTFGAQTRKFGFPKTGSHRAKFILESVVELKKNLRSRGNDLLIRIGKPEEILRDLTLEVRASWVFCNRERTEEELKVQDAVEQQLWTIGREIRYSRGKMLYYTSDLPFPVTHTPDVFTNFRKEVEKITPVRDPLPTPVRIPRLIEDNVDYGEPPTLSDFGISEPVHDERAAIHFAGGESEGLARLNEYFFDTEAVANYKETRNGLIGKNYSTKFSAWLAQGCLSPKRIYHELKQFEDEVVSNDSTYWVFFELLWREFFRLQGKKYDEKIFLKGGPKEAVNPRWHNDRRLLDKWIEGQTGIPFIDANMREIAATGFMSNRGRQNVASFLVKDLHLNWQMGAEYFESVLTDYDVTSNWCNWNYVAGIGSDPREDRYFNILSQAERYDPKGEYVKLWCPELATLPAEWIHKPDQMPPHVQEEYGVKIGGHYPKAIVPTEKWSKNGKRRGGNRDRGRKKGRGNSRYVA
ncbi:cryptochrome DASH [Lewinellaceae bacterium SD302]|nr:cryptochrome DASH [Lewinellaceae bacterium SD302]